MSLVRNLNNFESRNKLSKLLFLITLIVFSNFQNLVAQIKETSVNLRLKEGTSVFTIGEIPSILIDSIDNKRLGKIYLRGVNFQPDYYEYQNFKRGLIDFKNLRNLQKLKIDTINWDFDQQLLVKSWQDEEYKYLQLDLNNNDNFKDDPIYSFLKVKKDSIIKNLPVLKATYNYNYYGKIKEGYALIKINPFDNYYTNESYNSINEKESDFVIQNYQYKEGFLDKENISTLFHVTNVFPYPDFTNYNFISIYINKMPNIKLDTKFNEIAVNQIKDTICLNNKIFIIDSINLDGSTLFLNEIVSKSKIDGFNVGDTIYNLTFLDSLKERKKNKVYLIDFWGIWCKPCIELIPELKNLSEKYSKSLEIVSIAVDRKMDIDIYSEFIKKNKMNWSHIYLKDGFKNRIINSLKIKNYPTTLLIEASGNILFRGNSGNFSNLKYLLSKLNE